MCALDKLNKNDDGNKVEFKARADTADLAFLLPSPDVPPPPYPLLRVPNRVAHCLGKVESPKTWKILFLPHHNPVSLRDDITIIEG